MLIFKNFKGADQVKVHDITALQSRATILQGSLDIMAQGLVMSAISNLRQASFCCQALWEFGIYQPFRISQENPDLATCELKTLSRKKFLEAIVKKLYWTWKFEKHRLKNDTTQKVPDDK